MADSQSSLRRKPLVEIAVTATIASVIATTLTFVLMTRRVTVVEPAAAAPAAKEAAPTTATAPIAPATEPSCPPPSDPPQPASVTTTTSVHIKRAVPSPSVTTASRTDPASRF